MTSAQIHNIFFRKFNGQRNFIAPDVIGYGSCSNKRVYELSSGEGILDRTDTILGVTVLDRVNGEWVSMYDLSHSFSGETKHADAETYIKSLSQ